MLHNGLLSTAVPSLLSYTAQEHLPRRSITLRGLGPSKSINNPENAPQTYPQANLREALS